MGPGSLSTVRCGMFEFGSLLVVIHRRDITIAFGTSHDFADAGHDSAQNFWKLLNPVRVVRVSTL